MELSAFQTVTCITLGNARLANIPDLCLDTVAPPALDTSQSVRIM
jgi:hypothetical protein